MAITSNQSVVLMDASGRSVEYARLQMRRGLESQFDASKMLPAEFAVTTDTKKAYLAFAAGDVKRISTYEDMTQDLADALAEIEQEYLDQISTATSKAQAATSAANTATQSANTATANANAAADEARKTTWNNKNLTNSTSASESQVETAAGAAVLTGVDGKTEQVTTTGAQLFDASKIKTIEIPGTIKIKNNGDGSFELDGTYTNYYGQNYAASLDKGTYFISTKESVEEKTMFFVRVVKEGIGTKDYYVGQTFQIDGTETKIKIYVQCDPNKTYNNVIITPMLNAGSEPLPWEPYTGGIPGPNPDYPIPVQGVGGKTGDESFKFNAVIQSYQLFDASKIKTIEIPGTIKIKNNGDGSFELDGTYTNYYGQNYAASLDKGTYFISTKESVEEKTMFFVRVVKEGIGTKDYYVGQTFQIDGTETKIKIYVQCDPNKTYNNVIITPMLNAGSEPLPWQPYQRSELPITLTHPLFNGDKLMQVKAGQTYVDADGATQTADRDLWGIYHKNVFISDLSKNKEFTFISTGNVADETITFGVEKIARNTTVSSVSMNSQKVSFCSHAIRDANFFIDHKPGTFMLHKPSNTSEWKLYFCFKKSDVPDLESFKTWLTEKKPSFVSGNPEEIYNYFEPFSDQTPFFGWTTPTGGCTITTDDLLEPIISADTAQTPEGSYLLTGYVEGLRARTLEQRILELEKKAIQEV